VAGRVTGGLVLHCSMLADFSGLSTYLELLVGWQEVQLVRKKPILLIPKVSVPG